MDKQREAFEAWVKREYPYYTDMSLEWMEQYNEYVLDEVQMAFKSWQADQQAKLDNYWEPSGKDYDRSIHHNPDASAWAEFFVETYPALKDKKHTMLGWFANAMMAMHDHMHAKQQTQWLPIETLLIDQLLDSKEMFVVRGFNIEGVASFPYKTDAYAVWLEPDRDHQYKFVRWPHNFRPTHWAPLPPEPKK